MALVGTLGRVFNVQVRFGADTTGFLGKMAQMGQRLNKIGQAMTMGLTLPIVAIGVNAVRMAANFEQSMNKVAAVTQGTAKEMELLNSVAQELGRTTKFSASQAADGMTFLAMAGFEVNEIAGAMPAVLDLAAAANMDLAQAADISSNIMTGYGMDVSELSGAIDVMAGAFTGANTDLQQLGEAMAYAGPSAAALGIPFEQTAAVLGMFGNAGVQATRAGTALREGLARLIQLQPRTEVALQNLGVTTLDTAGNFRDLTDIMVDLAVAMDEKAYTGAQRLSTAIEIFGKRAATPFVGLLSQGTDELLKFVDALEDTQGLAADIAETQMEGLNGQITKLRSAFEGLMIVIGEAGILEALTEFAEKVTKWIQLMAEADPKMIQLALKIAGIVAAIGPLLIILGQIIAIAPAVGTAATVMFGPWGIAIAAVTTVLGFFVSAQISANMAVEEAISPINDHIEAMRTEAREINEVLIETNKLKESNDDTSESFESLRKKIIDLIEKYPDYATEIGLSTDETGHLYDITGDLITDIDKLYSTMVTFETTNYVKEMYKAVDATKDLKGAVEDAIRLTESWQTKLANFMREAAGVEAVSYVPFYDPLTGKYGVMEAPTGEDWFVPPWEKYGPQVSEEEEEEEERRDSDIRQQVSQDELTDAQQKAEDRLTKWTDAMTDYELAVHLAKDQLESNLITQEEYEQKINSAMLNRINIMMRLNVEQELSEGHLRRMNSAIALYTFGLEEQEQALAQIEWDEQIDAWRAVREANIAYYEELREMTWRMQGLFQPTDMDMDAVDRFYSLVEEAGREKAEAWWRDEYGDKPFPDADDTGIKDKADKLSDQLGDALLNGIDGLIRAVASGNIGQAIAKLFNQLGNIIAQHVSKMISASIGGGGMFGSIMGAIGGGIIGMGIGMLGGLFGGKDIPGATEANLSYVFITNWEDFFKFGFTLPSSYVYSGRADRLGVDPHGRVLDHTWNEWEDGDHFDQ